MQIIDKLIGSRKGKLYFKFVVAVAVIAAAFYAYSAIAAVPTSTPAIVNTNGTTINGVPIANASIARVSDQLFGYANFTSENGTQEENSTFKWLKRTLYQPQNLACGVDKGHPLIADGNANKVVEL